MALPPRLILKISVVISIIIIIIMHYVNISTNCASLLLLRPLRITQFTSYDME
jgi:hypothetical protein